MIIHTILENKQDLWSTNGNNHKDIIDKISKDIDKAPAPEDFHVYTGINGKKNETKDLFIYQIYINIIDIHVAAKVCQFAKNRHTEEYKKCINEIIVLHNYSSYLKDTYQKGQKLAHMLPPHSDIPTEKEFLINKGHTITIGNHVDIKMHMTQNNIPHTSLQL